MKLLLKLFIKNYEDTSNPIIREKYGKLAGAAGIASNLFLCTLKIITGLLTGSISILADGINNLADASSSIITLVGFRLASRPSDEDHPYGHARIEYITGLIVSMIIVVIGFQLILTSVDKIRNPEPPDPSSIAVLVLLLSIAVKVWQSRFNIKMGKAIASSTLKATGADSRNDVLATSAVLASLLINRFTGYNLDGYMGVVVALFIMYSGYQLIKETSGPLLGQAPDMELVQNIRDQVLSYPGVLGIHDLVVHDYGPGRIFASVHVEVDASADVMDSHDLIDNIERNVGSQLKMQLVIHMDPLNQQDPLTLQVKKELDEIVSQTDFLIGIHDLRTISGKTHHNIVFDAVISPDCTMAEDMIKGYLTTELLKRNPLYNTVITIDRNYTHL